MEGPTYVALSAQVALERQLGVIANNIANASTNGFKADRPLFQSYVDRLAVPGRTMAFVQDRATYIDRSQGPIETTSNPLNLAIKGDGFFAVSGPAGIEYTRDGRLSIGNDGSLQDSSGRSFLGDDGMPVTLPSNYTNLDIHGDGSIFVTVNDQQQQVGRIGTFRPPNPVLLRKAGDGLINVPGGMAPIDPEDPASRIVQGALEGSTIQPVTEIANMTELSRAYERLQSLLSDDNSREREMIQALGQFS